MLLPDNRFHFGHPFPLPQRRSRAALNYPLAAAISTVVLGAMMSLLLVWYLAFDACRGVPLGMILLRPGK